MPCSTLPSDAHENTAAAAQISAFHQASSALGVGSARSATSLSLKRQYITHAVQDVDRWLAGKAERHAVLPGVKNATDLVALDGSNHTAWVFDFDDMDALKAVVSSMPPEVAAKAESHGVIMPMTVYVEP